MQLQLVTTAGTVAFDEPTRPGIAVLAITRLARCDFCLGSDSCNGGIGGQLGALSSNVEGISSSFAHAFAAFFLARSLPALMQAALKAIKARIRSRL